MNAQPFINEEHGYYRISKDNISLLIDNYCQELGDNFIVYIDKNNDFDNFYNVIELVISILEERRFEYRVANFPDIRYIDWLIPEPPNDKEEIYRHRDIQIHWYSSENPNPLQFKGKKAVNILMSDNLFNDSNFLLWVSSVNTHDFRNFKFKTGFKEIDDKEGSD